jgi:hypothetical protein
MRTTRPSEVEQLSDEILDRCEEFHADTLRQQVEAAERAFEKGDVVSLAELKQRNNL